VAAQYKGAAVFTTCTHQMLLATTLRASSLLDLHKHD